MSTRRFYCTANHPFTGRFGDLIWATTRDAAEVEFYRIHGVFPTLVQLMRGAW